MMMVLLSIQEMSEQLGIRLLNEKRIDPSMQDSFEYFFPQIQSQEHTILNQWDYRKCCEMQQQELGLKICIKYFIKFNLISTICHKYFVKRVI